MRTVIALFGLALGACGSFPEARLLTTASAPVLARLATRDRVLTIYSSRAPARYAVHGTDGRLLAEGRDLDELRVREPALWRVYRSAYASSSSGSVLLAD